MRDRIVPDLLARRVRDTPGANAFCTLDAHDAWQSLTWQEYAARIGRIVDVLRTMGIKRSQRVGILAPTSLDWDCTQMACLFVGAAVAGIDANYAKAQRDEILRSLQLQALFVADEPGAASLPADVIAGLTGLVHFADTPMPGPSGAASLPMLIRESVARGDAPFMADAQADDDALIVFSSGTTGRPKAIAYTHDQVQTAIRAIIAAYPDLAPGTRLLCWLPLANLFQRIVNLCGMVQGATSYIIGDPKEVMRYVPRVKPHLMIGVPRFYEKLHDGVSAKVAASPRRRLALAHWALATGARYAQRPKAHGRRPSLAHPVAFAADRLVLRRLRQAFGGHLRYFVSGSAPMPQWLLAWFDSIGLPVFEAYGVSENIIPIAMNRPGARRLGTVGKPVPGQEVKLSSEHEILVRGPGVFRGYLAHETSGAGSPAGDGFWATGDLGEFDAEGFLRVTGRKADMFKLATGRWVVPVAVEAALRRIPCVEHALVVGAGGPWIVAIVAVDAHWSPQSTPHSPPSSAAALSASSAAAIEVALRQGSEGALADLPAYMRPAGILVTATPFAIDSGELTSNLKLRRAAVMTKYAHALAVLQAALVARAQAPAGQPRDEMPPLLVRFA